MKRRFGKCEDCDRVSELNDSGECVKCGTLVSKPIPRVPDVLAFRPHFNYSLGKYVNSQAEMERLAIEVGIEKHGVPIQMRRG